ncbi:energy transducer TonB [Spirosoma pomorum]
MKFVFTFLLLSTLCLSLATLSHGQARKELVYTVAERQPEFPGGQAALTQYLAQNIKYPGSLIRKNRNADPVDAKFIVDKDGVVRDVRVVTKSADKMTQKGMESFMKTVITAIEKMPRWRPGEVNNQPVAVFYTLPITVNLQ